MKAKLIAIGFGLLAACSAFSATNLVVIGNSRPPSTQGHFFNLPAIPWQANIVPLVFLATGLFHLFCPRACWYFKWGWRFADSEPSDLWLFFEQAGGVLIIGFSIFAFLAANGIISHFTLHYGH